MIITLNIRTEFEAELARKTALEGRAFETYVAVLLSETDAIPYVGRQILYWQHALAVMILNKCCYLVAKPPENRSDSTCNYKSPVLVCLTV